MSFECECVTDCGLQFAYEVGMTVLPTTWTGCREDGARATCDIFGCDDAVSISYVLLGLVYDMLAFYGYCYLDNDIHGGIFSLTCATLGCWGCGA